MRRGRWRDRRLVEYAQDVVRSRPDRPAVVDEAGSLTYAELWEMARRVAGWLAKRGVRAGTAVSVQLPNWWEFQVINLAVEILGGVLNPLLPIYRDRELRHVLNTCETKVLVVPPQHGSYAGFVEMAAALSADVDSLDAVLVVRPDGAPLPGGFASFEDAMAAAPVDPVAGISPDAPALVAFTSGTESAAKGCTHSSNTANFGPLAIADELRLTERDVVFMPSPLGHATGVNWGARTAVLLGTTLVLQDRWDPAVACRLIGSHRCSFTTVATPFIVELVDHVKAGCPEADLASLRFLISGGAPIPRDLVTTTQEVLGADLLACYGQAETFMITLVRQDDPVEVKASCDGWPLPGVQVEARDDSGTALPAGREGEAFTRGPHVMLGYLNPPAGQRYAPGDWLPTGDFVVLDEGRRLRVVGRRKEIIIRGGVNISPREVEEGLAGHPGVAQVAVMGFADQRLGERACAVVVPQPGATLTLDALTAHLRTRGFAPYKLPERLELVDELPMSPSGKVLKKELRTWLSDRVGQP